MVDSELCQYITNNKIMIFSQTNCPYCIKAKRILDKMELKYLSKELDVDAFKNNKTLDQLNKLCGFETLPKIFIGNKFIGGCDDLILLIYDGTFYKILKEQGINYPVDFNLLLIDE